MLNTITRGLGLGPKCQINHEELNAIKSFYDLELGPMLDEKNPPITMNDVRGKVLIVCNTASKCGLTGNHYKQLEDLYQRYHENGFMVLGYPCGQFANQEHTEACKIRDGLNKGSVTFPVFARTLVNGPESSKIFKWLKYNAKVFGASPESRKDILEDIGWNFGKFLIDRDGKVVSYHGPKVDPSSMESEIKRLLEGK